MTCSCYFIFLAHNLVEYINTIYLIQQFISFKCVNLLEGEIFKIIIMALQPLVVFLKAFPGLVNPETNTTKNRIKNTQPTTIPTVRMVSLFDRPVCISSSIFIPILDRWGNWNWNNSYGGDSSSWGGGGTQGRGRR